MTKVNILFFAELWFENITSEWQNVPRKLQSLIQNLIWKTLVVMNIQNMQAKSGGWSIHPLFLSKCIYTCGITVKTLHMLLKNVWSLSRCCLAEVWILWKEGRPPSELAAAFSYYTWILANQTTSLLTNHQHFPSHFVWISSRVWKSYYAPAIPGMFQSEGVCLRVNCFDELKISFKHVLWATWNSFHLSKITDWYFHSCRVFFVCFGC